MKIEKSEAEAWHVRVRPCSRSRSAVEPCLEGVVRKRLRVSISINFAARKTERGKRDVHASEQTPDAAYFCEEPSPFTQAACFPSCFLTIRRTSVASRVPPAKSRPACPEVINCEGVFLLTPMSKLITVPLKRRDALRACARSLVRLGF